MKAEIISIGTEILFGQIVDTNSAWLAQRLPTLGIDLYYVSTVGDNQGRIVQTLRRAWERSDVIITTGGLGPTEDDLTRESIAEMLGETQRVVPELEDALRARFARRGGPPMPERNIKQATLVPSARAIPNPRGSAPGWWTERDGHIIVSMPGVPSEMFYMWENEAAPELLSRSDGSVLLSKIIKTNGMGEALVDELLSPLLSSNNPSIGVYAKNDGIHLRLSAKAARPPEAQRMLDELEPKVNAILGDIIWGYDDETPAAAVGRLLKDRGLTLATMESCTGGLVSSLTTDIAGSSTYFKGGAVTYTNAQKVAHGVHPSIIEQHGAISAECAQAMAVAIRERMSADVGISVTGVAGPDPVEGKDIGTVFIGVATADNQRVMTGGIYQRSRVDIKSRAATNSLLFLRRVLLGLE